MKMTIRNILIILGSTLIASCGGEQGIDNEINRIDNNMDTPIDDVAPIPEPIIEPILDITMIAGKLESDVAAYLGSPISCRDTRYGKSCQYTKGETEVVFIQGAADWITVEGIDEIPFNSAALEAIGLDETSPSFSNAFTLRWNSIQGIREVSIFQGARLSDYAYIKVTTQ